MRIASHFALIAGNSASRRALRPFITIIQLGGKVASADGQLPGDAVSSDCGSLLYPGLS